MTTQMMIRIDAELKENVQKLARRMGKNTSQIMRESLEEYIKRHDLSGYMDGLWERMGKKLKSRRVGLEDIPRIIREVRDSKK